MRKFGCLFSVLTVFCFFSASAQQSGNTQENNSAAQQADQPAQTTAAQQSPADTTDVASPPDSGAAPAVSRAAMQQTTTSQGGSPAVFVSTKEPGPGRDGTNNAPRATMNMAGSPAKNIDLDADKTVDPDEELEDRQDDAQEKQISVQNQSGGQENG